jgi:hypothetical protein
MIIRIGDVITQIFLVAELLFVRMSFPFTVDFLLLDWSGEMKIFVVVCHEGEYSDQSWNIMGTFSSEELAQAHIDKLTHVPEELIEKYKDLYETEVLATWRQIASEKKARLEELVEDEGTLNRAIDHLKAKIRLNEKNNQSDLSGLAILQKDLSATVREKNNIEYFLNNGKPWTDLNGYIRGREYSRNILNPIDLSIEEHELDQA